MTINEIINEEINEIINEEINDQLMTINVPPTREARQTHNIKVKHEARNHPIGFALRVYYM